MPINSAKTKKIAWVLTACVLVLNFVSFYFNLFRNEKIVWWDEAVHLVTTFVITLLLVSYLYGRTITGARNHKFIFVLTVMFVGLALGTSWEFYEWTREHMTPEKTLITNKWDTMIDLLMDAIGATITGIITIFAARKT